MSVSQFPNVTDDVASQLIKLLDQVLPAQPGAIVDDAIVRIGNAYACAFAEAILNAQEIRASGLLNPTVVAQINNIIDACR